jgi:hypothetical protein
MSPSQGADTILTQSKTRPEIAIAGFDCSVSLADAALREGDSADRPERERVQGFVRQRRLNSNKSSHVCS